MIILDSWSHQNHCFLPTHDVTTAVSLLKCLLKGGYNAALCVVDFT